MAIAAAAQAVVPSAGPTDRGAREELQNQSIAALARLDAIVSGGAQYTPDQVRDAVVDIAGVVCRVSRVLRAT